MLKFPDTGENILANAARLFFPPLEEQFSHNAYITLTTLFYKLHLWLIHARTYTGTKFNF